MSPQPESLKDKIDALTRKTEHNRNTTRRAQAAADSALNQTTDTEPVRHLAQNSLIKCIL